MTPPRTERAYDAVVVFAPDASDVAEQLRIGLGDAKCTVWSEASLRVGDDRWREFDRALATARLGVLLVSPGLLDDGLRAGATIERYGSQGRLLPVLHGISREQFAERWPTLAGIEVVATAATITPVVSALAARIRPRPPRSKGKRRAPLWTVNIIAPAPLDRGTTAVADSLFVAYKRLIGQPYDVVLDAPAAQSIAGITGSRRQGGTRSVVHVHAAANRGRFVVEDLDFGGEAIPPRYLVAALRLSNCTVVVLTGGDHTAAAAQIHAELGLPVLHTTRRLTDRQLAAAVFDTFSGLFSGHLGEDRADLPDGVAMVGDLGAIARPGPGSISLTDRYRDVERRARNGRSRVQTKALHRAYGALRKHHVVQVHGPVGSGVSTSLKILADHLRLDGFEFYHGPVSIDLRNAHSLEEVHRIACLQVDLAENSLASLITRHTIGFCIDGGDANPELLRELIEQVALVEGQLKSRFVFGLEEALELAGSVPVALNRLEMEEMRLILRSEVGTKLAAQYEPALAIAHPSPGGIYAIVQNIAAGFSPDRVCEILEAGETHSAVADKILSTARLRPLAHVVAVLGPHFPMEIARAIFERQLRDQGDAMPIDRFGSLAHEFDRLGVWSEASQHGVDHSYYRLDRSGTYYSVNPGMLEQLRKRTPIVDLGDQAGFDERVADVVLHWLGSPNFPTIAADGSWLTSVAKAMMEWGQIDALSTMASRLVESRQLPSGQSVMPLRINGDPTDVRELLDVLRRATDRTATEWADADVQWLHERCLLFYAETCYKLNEIDAAIDEFGMQVELPGASGNLLVRAHRALGQIAFRAADYTEAKTQFDLAAEQTDVLPRFIVTLNLERSKLELRRGDAREARLRLTTAESLLAADSSAARDKIDLERGNIDRLERDYRSAFDRYRALVENERCNPTTRATAAYYLAMVATDRRLPGFNDPVAVAEASSVLDSLVALNRGHELIGIMSSCSELLIAASRGAAPPPGFEVELRSIAARMTRGRRLDLLDEFRHALEAGARYYVVP